MMGIADVAVRVRERFVVVDMGVRHRQIGAVGMAVFNLLVDGDRWTLIDWSTAVLADPHYDLAFTDLMLRNPPLGGSPLLRSAATRIGARIARRFLDRYELRSGKPIDAERLAWGQQVHATRALVEVAGWRAAGTEDAHRGHPWLTLEPPLREVLRTGART